MWWLEAALSLVTASNEHSKEHETNLFISKLTYNFDTLYNWSYYNLSAVVKIASFLV